MSDDKFEKASPPPYAVPAFDTDDDDDRELVALGYKPSFKREFSNLATVRHSALA